MSMKRLWVTALVALMLAPAGASADRGRGGRGEHGERKERGERKNPFVAIPVSGTSADGNAFAGTMDVAGFVTDEFGALKAIGILNGVITAPGGRTQPVANHVVSLPVVGGSAGPVSGIGAQQAVQCDILNLVLGPLDLNLLGLNVHLNQVVLDIVAVPGPGNLLGNLLCAVAGLLDGLAIGPILAQLLNQLLGVIAL